MNLKRLNTLIEFMDNLPEVGKAHFNMGAWVQHDGEEWIIDTGVHGINGPIDVTVEKLKSCGMTACAIGWACLVPAFRKAGLEYSNEENESVLSPSYKGEVGWDAVEKFFGLTGDQAYDLFGDHLVDDVTTPKQWAKHARKELKKLEV